MSGATLLVGDFAGERIALTLDEIKAARERCRAVLGAIATPDTSSKGDPDEPLLDSAQLAAVLGFPQTAIEERTRGGEIPCVRLGRRIRYRRSVVEAALACRANHPREPE